MLAQRIYAEISLDAICQNVQNVMQKIGSETKVMAVVKADAYGHGAVPVAKALSSIGVYGFGVATAKEALVLRHAGIQNAILVLGPVFTENLKDMILSDISLTVFTLEDAKEISNVATALHKTAKLHIKVDTGMGRIGLQPQEESLLEIEQIAKLPNITLEGIFTHFASADEKDLTACLQQKEIFLSFVEKMKQKGITFQIQHMCNSAAILDFDEGFLDMVRCGIVTYGLYPSADVNQDSIKLYPAMQLKSHISFIKTVPKGFKVSYGSTFETSKETTIATVPVGYADGYPRALSSKGEVLIHGQRAKILGRICMDQMMVDVSDIPNVKKHDEVTLFGENEGKKISIEEVADLAGSFNYELICNISKRVPRVYFYQNKVVSVVDALD